jgi:hypothetical protein
MGDETTTQLGYVLMSMIRAAPASTLRKEGEGAKEGGRGRWKLPPEARREGEGWRRHKGEVGASGGTREGGAVDRG